MKKVLFIAFIATAVCFASCGNKTQKAAEADTVAVAEEDNFTTALKAALDNKDAASLQAAIEAAQVKIAELTKEGKLEEAKTALVSVQTWLKDNAETVKSVTGDNEAINTLIEKGTKVLVCGTCLNFYGIKDDLKVGTVSNMYDILGAMQEVSKVIKL